MKKILCIILCLWAGAIGPAWAKGGDRGAESAPTAARTPEGGAILFVGIREYYLSSNYYTKEQIADHFGVNENELENYFNGAIRNAFDEAVRRQNLSIRACDESTAPVLRYLDYEYRDGVLCSSLTGADGDALRQSFDAAGARYLLVCDQYQVQKETRPYENFAHILHYTVFDNGGQKVYDGFYQYAALDLGNREMLDKQLRRAAGKFLKAIQ